MKDYLLIKPMKQTFTIEGRLEGLNSRINADRTNRYLGAKLKKENMALVIYAIRKYCLVKMREPIHLTIRWYEANRKRDLDNVASAIKDIQDALVMEGIISNDGWNGVAGFNHYFEVDKKHPRVEVELEEV